MKIVCSKDASGRNREYLLQGFLLDLGSDGLKKNDRLSLVAFQAEQHTQWSTKLYYSHSRQEPYLEFFMDERIQHASDRL